MFVLDDILIKPFTSILDILHTMALNELYDTAEIKDDIKENQLLYELGERSESEYKDQKQELEAQLEMAKQIKSQMSGQIEVKG